MSEDEYRRLLIVAAMFCYWLLALVFMAALVAAVAVVVAS